MLLAVEELHVHFISRSLRNRLRTARALNGVSFRCGAGEILGIVGETGAGKSLSAHAVMGLLRPPARLIGGTIRFAGRELASLADAERRALRGREMAIVVQNAKSSLDALCRIGDQLVRLYRAHRGGCKAAARARALEIMAAVGIPDPERRMRAWPHELSGGMAQRVLIALALINEPKLLIADEPTTGLDVTVQAQILDLIVGLARERGMGVILITHDLGVVAHYCDRIAVMFAGRVVETGPVRAVFGAPAHPYTRALISATPERLSIGRGTGRAGPPPPNLYALPEGCHYRDRCPIAAPECAARPADKELGAGHIAACWHAGAAMANADLVQPRDEPA
ncbi:MAG: ABC transporter ATP-binding protein [Alphaproteobacteria bacterium]|nr:ABC transporter ATP-binding protein [Alphaproteobacteria bacterium]